MLQAGRYQGVEDSVVEHIYVGDEGYREFGAMRVHSCDVSSIC